MQLVAPAGSMSGLVASISGGADAVYLGMPKFGARAKADNFDLTALKMAVEYAHTFGVKVFVTLNTLIKDGEMTAALDAARAAYDIGVDAAIVQDLRFIERLKTAVPDFTLHASTQMGIHNKAGALALQRLGISRAVLARETLPEDIVKIKSTGIDVEYFVQGALCICFSGNCYFSSLASSYSGNRGKCMQLCRKPYFFHGKRGYFLSAKDLCLYDKLGELEALGVDAIKIEGRMRSDEYAYRAASVYKSNMPCDKAFQALKAVFNRGDYCHAYLDKDAPFRVIYPQTQSNIGKSVGKIASVKGKTLYVKGFTAHPADGFKILRDGSEICGATAKNGTITADGNCRVGDELRLTFDGELSQKVKSLRRTLEVDVYVKLAAGEPVTARLTAGNSEISLVSDFMAESALSVAATDADIEKTFAKVSDYPFVPRIQANVSSGAFVPASKLNEFRRTAYKALFDKIQSDYKITRSNKPYLGLDYNKFDGHGKILMVESADILTEDMLEAVDYIAINPRDYSDFSVPTGSKPVLLWLPPVMRGNDKDIIAAAVNDKRIHGVIANNLYAFSVTDKPILIGPLLNVIGSTDMPHIRSFEADGRTNGFDYAFGFAPVMTLCHCPYGKCVNCSGDDELRDEDGRRFKLRRYKLDKCYWQLLNCVPHNTVKYVKQSGDMFFDCTAADKNDIVKILSGNYDGPHTVGNLNKGLK